MRKKLEASLAGARRDGHEALRAALYGMWRMPDAPFAIVVEHQIDVAETWAAGLPRHGTR